MSKPHLPRIARTTLMLTALFAVDKVLAFVRQMIVGRQFRLSAAMDAFNAANNLPDLLFALISGGALAMAFIPVLAEYRTTRGRDALWELFSRVANLAFLVTAGLAVLFAVLALPLIRWEFGIAPRFTPEQQRLAADLMRLDLIGTVIFSLSGLVTAGLQANQHFFLPALAPLTYNLGQIFGAAVLAPQQVQWGPVRFSGLGLGIHGLVYGVLLGAVLHFGVQVPGLVRYGFRWRPLLGWRHPGVQKVLRLMGPRVLTMLFIQLVFLARDNLASRVGTGAVSALAYGWFIMQVPETLLGTALGFVLLPTLSEQIARGDWRAFAATLNRGLQGLLALTLPIAAVLAVALPGLVPVLGLGEAGTRLVVWATRAYLVGLAGHSLLELVARGFYAQQDARTPLLASALNTAAYVGLGVLAILSGRNLGAEGLVVGTTGIGLANAVAFTTEALLLLALLHRRHRDTPRLGRAGRDALLASVGGGLTAWAVMAFLPAPGLVRGILALLAGGGVALVMVWREVVLLLSW